MNNSPFLDRPIRSLEEVIREHRRRECACGNCMYFEPGLRGWCKFKQDGRDHDEPICSEYDRAITPFSVDDEGDVGSAGRGP